MLDAEQNTVIADADYDQVSNVLKWVLLITAIICFAAVGTR